MNGINLPEWQDRSLMDLMMEITTGLDAGKARTKYGLERVSKEDIENAMPPDLEGLAAATMARLFGGNPDGLDLIEDTP